MKISVVHTGARDSYQVATAFFEDNTLYKLFTSAYLDSARARTLAGFGISTLQSRTSPIPAKLVSPSFLLDAAKNFGRRLGVERLASAMGERALGRRAARRSKDADIVVSYNYMAQHVLPFVNARRVLFQCHPNPAALSSLGKTDGELRASGFGVEREFAWGSAYRTALEREWSFADSIVAPSSFVKTSLMMAGAASDRITIVPYGCPTVGQTVPRTIPTGRLKLLFVGQFVWRKGADLLADFAQAMRHRADINVITRGLCDQNLMAKLHREPNVKVMTSVSNAVLQDCYMHSDALIFPSRYEGYGLVINEALSFGLPVISTENTALPDIFQTHQAGRIMKEASAVAMAESVEDLFTGQASAEASELALRYASSNPWSKFRERMRAAVGT